jgi:hypothetical protein
MYKTGYNGSLAVGQAACQTEYGEPQPRSTGPRRARFFGESFVVPVSNDFRGAASTAGGRLKWRGTGLRDTQVHSWEWNFPKVGRGKHFLSDFVFGGF